MTEFEKLRIAIKALETIKEANKMAKAFRNTPEETLLIIISLAEATLEEINNN